MCLCLKYLVQSSKWRVELSVWKVVFFPVPEEIAYYFLVYFWIVQIWPIYHSLEKRVWYTIIFLPVKESLTLFQIWIFCYTFTYFVPFGVIKNRVTKVNSKYFKRNCAEAWLFEKFIFELDASSYSFKIINLLRQVISLKKMVVSSAKFIILISWSPTSIPLILLLALMKLASTSAAITYKIIEKRHPWQTSRVRVKGTDRGPFILILDWILVYTSLTMWMNFSPYPNLCKAEKVKFQSTLRILQKYFCSVYLTHQLCNK